MNTCLMRSPHYLGQFAKLSLGKESSYISSKFNLLNMDTPVIQTFTIAPSVSILMGYTVQVCVQLPYK